MRTGGTGHRHGSQATGGNGVLRAGEMEDIFPQTGQNSVNFVTG